MKNLLFQFKKNYLKKIISIIIPLILFFLFSNISIAAKPIIKSTFSGDSVTITVKCSECEAPTPGKIQISEHGNIKEKTFNDLPKAGPFVFSSLKLNTTYNIQVIAYGDNNYLFYNAGGYGKTTATSSFNTNTGTGDSTSENSSFKTVVKKETSKAIVSITCFTGCGAGLEGSFTLKGNNYTQTSSIKSFKTNTPINFIFTGLENGKTYTVSGAPYNTNNTEIVFKDFSFTMDNKDIVVSNDVTYLHPDENQSDNNKGESLNYKLLAPIGTTTEIKTNDIGKYFNILFDIAIGLAGALAVIMLVIGGVQWMGSESVFGKTQGKERIISALVGLLIAIGSYTILNTINPNLLGKKGLAVGQIAISLEQPILSDANTSVPTGTNNSFALCPGGVSKINIEGRAVIGCTGDVLNNLKNMIIAAKAAGINFTAAGFRTRAVQIQARKDNGCNPVDTALPSKCTKAPTAIPGTSMHEQGVAFDFSCDGKLINPKIDGSGIFAIHKETQKCFDWLVNNSKTYNKGGKALQNLKSEPWHWSINGK